MIDWASTSNHLLLNPRLPQETRVRYESAWSNLVARDTAQLGIATSGSSGDAFGKLIVIGKAAILANAASVNEHFESDVRDVWLKTLPNFHVGGIGIFARAHLSDALVIESKQERWEPMSFHAELESSGATMLSLVPTQLFDLVHLNLRSPPELRAVVIGGGRLEAGLRERGLELGWPIYASYGCTECSSQVATASKPGSDDLTPLSHVAIRTDENGRIALRSEALLTGQITLTADAESFHDPKIDGWFSTEDRGELVAGSLHVQGRVNDFVKIGGEGVLMSRLEDRLEKLRAEMGLAGDAVVLAAADDRLGAVVVLITNLESTALVARFNEGVLPFERIRAVHQVAAVPRSALGKVLRGAALALVGLKSASHV